jgi:gas vesicle protein
MRRVFSFLTGIVLGGLVGSILALLFTPSSGAELRTQIRERADSFSGEIRQAVSTKRIELQDRLETLRTPKA